MKGINLEDYEPVTIIAAVDYWWKSVEDGEVIVDMDFEEAKENYRKGAKMAALIELEKKRREEGAEVVLIDIEREEREFRMFPILYYEIFGTGLKKKNQVLKSNS